MNVTRHSEGKGLRNACLFAWISRADILPCSLMHLLLRIIFLLLAGLTVARAEELPVGADTLLTDPARDPAWSDLFARLAPDQARQSQFEERRYFPFRKTPVVLKGEIRIMPARGLSLRYLEPEHRVLIVDAQGLLMRDEEGHERAAPSDSRAQAITSALVSVLRFDLPTLVKSFAVHGRRDGAAWTLAFVPLEPSLAELIGVLAVSGQDTRLDRIELVKSPNQRIEILISGTREKVIFPGDVLTRFFR
jgi:hypothetical protein